MNFSSTNQFSLFHFNFLKISNFDFYFIIINSLNNVYRFYPGKLLVTQINYSLKILIEMGKGLEYLFIILRDYSIF